MEVIIKGVVITAHSIRVKVDLWGFVVFPYFSISYEKLPQLNVKKDIEKYGKLPYVWKHIRFDFKWAVWWSNIYIRWDFKQPLPGRS